MRRKTRKFASQILSIQQPTSHTPRDPKAAFLRRANPGQPRHRGTTYEHELRTTADPR
jgi:hypothetical protein